MSIVSVGTRSVQCVPWGMLDGGAGEGVEAGGGGVRGRKRRVEARAMRGLVVGGAETGVRSGMKPPWGSLRARRASEMSQAV